MKLGQPSNHSLEIPTEWNLYVDDSLNKTGSGAGVIIESDQGIQIELSLKFGFPASNNQAEYEALLAGLKLAKEVGAQKLIISSDSQVVTSQIARSYQAKDPTMKNYLDKTKEQLRQLGEYEVRHIPREQNARADTLSKLASTKPGATIEASSKRCCRTCQSRKKKRHVTTTDTENGGKKLAAIYKPAADWQDSGSCRSGARTTSLGVLAAVVLPAVNSSSLLLPIDVSFTEPLSLPLTRVRNLVIEDFGVNGRGGKSIDDLRLHLAHKQVWMASSIHRGEEEIILGVHTTLMQLQKWRFATTNEFGLEVIPACASEFCIKVQNLANQKYISGQ
ncbi:hypothetical protein AHAS_Ahas16G0165700 [Arachis hypogaea]